MTLGGKDTFLLLDAFRQWLPPRRDSGVASQHREIDMSKLKVVFAEDHPASRTGLRCVLEDLDDIEIVGEAENGREAVDLVDKLKPDIVVLDVGMPVMDGIEAAKIIKERHPATKIIMLTAHDSESDTLGALVAGAQGYCLKGTPIDRLHRAILSVAAGDLWLDSGIASLVTSAIPKKGCGTQDREAKATGHAPFEPLSPRETEVLELLCIGLSNLEIGERLSVSPETVKTHIKHVMVKLAASDRTQAAVKAVRAGLVRNLRFE